MASSDFLINIVAETKGFEKAENAMAQTKLSLEQMIKLFNSIGKEFTDEQLRHTKEINQQIEENKKKRTAESQELTKQFRQKRFQNAEERKERNNDAIMGQRLKREELKTERESLRTEKLKDNLLKSQNSSLGSIIGKYITLAALMKVVDIARQGSARIEGYNLQGDITQLRPSDIKTFAYAGRRFGATEESARQTISSVTSQVEAFKRGENPQLAEALGRAGIQTAMKDFDNAFTLMRAVSEGMKGWRTPEEVRQGFDILKSIFDPATLLTLKAGFDKQMQIARDFVIVSPEEHKQAQMLYDTFVDLGIVAKELKDKLAVGITAVIGSSDEVTKAFIELAPAVEGLGKLVGWVFKLPIVGGEMIAKAQQALEERGNRETEEWRKRNIRGRVFKINEPRNYGEAGLPEWLPTIMPQMASVAGELRAAQVLAPQNYYNTQNTGGQILLNMTNNTTVNSLNDATQFNDSMANVQINMANNLSQRTGFSLGDIKNNSTR